jgi:5-methylcytosine-specific restriction endonuclease McrA
VFFKDGQWCAVVSLPKSRTGRRRRRWVRANRFCDALAALTADATRTADAEKDRLIVRAGAQAIATHTEGEWWALVRSVEGRCFYCGVDTRNRRFAPTDPGYLNMDHKTPLSRGGSDGIDNLAVACRRCNAEKGMMTVDEYLAWKAA